MTANDTTMPRALTRAEFAVEIARRAGRTERLVVAIVGPPGSGKSTVSELLRIACVETHGVVAQIVPMDGFHFDNRILDDRGQRHRKGASETFDVDGMAAVLERLTRPDAQDVAVPVFDRENDVSRASARLIGAGTRVLLVEGNYLLLRHNRWSGLRRYFDLSAMIGCDLPTLRARLMRRGLDLGIDPEQAAAKVDGNDIPNAETVLRDSFTADVELRCDEG